MPQQTREQVEALGLGFVDVRADRGDTACIPALIDERALKSGGFHILVNNAGIIRRADAIDFTDPDWDAVVDLNRKSVLFVSQAAARHYLTRAGEGEGGSAGLGRLGACGSWIIHVASILSFEGGIPVASHTASKSGVLGLTRLMANEWARHGICVNAIAPGDMETNNIAALPADTTGNATILDRVPAARWGQPQDLAGPVVFLAPSASDYVHGHTLAVDGGWLAR